ncbi:hypothetical protein D3C77_699450 [compost metagenome]
MILMRVEILASPSRLTGNVTVAACWLLASCTTPCTSCSALRVASRPEVVPPFWIFNSLPRTIPPEFWAARLNWVKPLTLTRGLFWAATVAITARASPSLMDWFNSSV